MRTEYPWTSIIFRYGQSHQPGLSCSLTGKGRCLVAGRQAPPPPHNKGDSQDTNETVVILSAHGPPLRKMSSQFFFFSILFIFFFVSFALRLIFFVLAMGTGL